jgi:predicted lipoprotein with Yx(FWY)xxD motif
MRRLVPMIAALALVVVACGGTDTTETTTSEAAATTTSAAPSTTTAGLAISPAEVVFEAQESDGSSIVVASVTLPSPGFIAVHANADGSPGPIIGHSDLLPEGTSTDVTVVLDTPVESTDLLFPMAHIDMDENGEYEFAPPDNAVDIPANTADGAVAVVGAEVTIAEAATGMALTISDGALGTMVVDSDANTLYLFTPDSKGESTCYDQCEANWPPLTGEISAGNGIDAALIGSTTRTDGSEQVTFNGWPVYYFAGDGAPGDANGQGINDVWFVVSPEGEALP